MALTVVQHTDTMAQPLIRMAPSNTGWGGGRKHMLTAFRIAWRSVTWDYGDEDCSKSISIFFSDFTSIQRQANDSTNRWDSSHSVVIHQRRLKANGELSPGTLLSTLLPCSALFEMC